MLQRQISDAPEIGWIGTRFEQVTQARMESRASRGGDIAIKAFADPVMGEGERSWSDRANELRANSHHQPLLD